MILPIFHHLLQSKAQQHSPFDAVAMSSFAGLMGPQNPLQNPWFAIRGSIRGSDGKSSVETHLLQSPKRLGLFEGPGKSGTRSIMQSDLLIHHPSSEHVAKTDSSAIKSASFLCQVG